MENLERRVGPEVRAMTRREVITKAIAGQLSWVQAAEILAITPRHMRRIRRGIERYGMSVVMDQRGGRPRRERKKTPDSHMRTGGFAIRLVSRRSVVREGH